MANQIRNAPTASVNAATYGGQSYPDAQDTDVWAAAVARTGVLSGCTVTQHSLGAISLRTTARNTTAESTSTKTITIPAAVLLGDLMLLCVQFDSHYTMTTPTGWTLLSIASPSVGTFAGGMGVWWKLAAAGDIGGAATISCAPTGGSYIASIMFEAWIGCDQTNPINASAAQLSAANGTTATAPSVTTTVGNCRIVELWSTTTNVALGMPGTVDIVSMVNSDNIFTSGASSSILITSGASGAVTASDGNGTWVGYTVALAPASGANMSVDVAAGSVLIGGTVVVVAAVPSNVISAANSTLDRVDIITVGTSGIPLVTTGTPAASPVWPAVSTLPLATAACLAMVYVPANATSILTANITDKREIFGPIRTPATRMAMRTMCR